MYSTNGLTNMPIPAFMLVHLVMNYELRLARRMMLLNERQFRTEKKHIHAEKYINPEVGGPKGNEVHGRTSGLPISIRMAGTISGRSSFAKEIMFHEQQKQRLH